MNFAKYKSPSWESSLFKGIPMSKRNSPFVSGMLAAGCKIYYRGPRIGRKDRYQARSNCLKADATTFAVYPPRQSYAVAWASS